MSGPRNLHRLAGALDQLRREAATGECHLKDHPTLGKRCTVQAVGWIEGWDLHPKGVCQVHAEQGRALHYTIHTLEELA
jgi:hypothetical protein